MLSNIGQPPTGNHEWWMCIKWCAMRNTNFVDDPLVRFLRCHALWLFLLICYDFPYYLKSRYVCYNVKRILQKLFYELFFSKMDLLDLAIRNCSLVNHLYYIRMWSQPANNYKICFQMLQSFLTIQLNRQKIHTRDSENFG